MTFHSRGNHVAWPVVSRNADIMLIATARGIVLDVRTRSVGADDALVSQSITAPLSPDDARALRDALTRMLQAAGKPADPGQTAAWSCGAAELT